jgi:hypothetical protein
MQLENGPVDSGSQPEVVGVDDKSAHKASLSTQGGAFPDEAAALV